MSRIYYFIFLVLAGCGQTVNYPVEVVQTAQAIEPKGIINPNGATVQTRFNVPEGYERKTFHENSFENFLRNLPLKPAGTKVKYYNGEVKNLEVADAVVDIDVGNKDLQQCADAVMRLRGEYFYSLKEYDKISFNLTNGFKTDYSDWMKGNRMVVRGNKTSWRKSAEPSNTYKDFRSYMDLIFSYAGSLSLSKSMHSKNIHDISIGDVFIIGGSPGHAVIVVDVAENKSGEKLFMIAQSYMPAQDIEILKNTGDENLSPWYSTANLTKDLITPQWNFTIDQLKTW
jgi:hypothetical protein